MVSIFNVISNDEPLVCQVLNVSNNVPEFLKSTAATWGIRTFWAQKFTKMLN